MKLQSKDVNENHQLRDDKIFIDVIEEIQNSFAPQKMLVLVEESGGWQAIFGLNIDTDDFWLPSKVAVGAIEAVAEDQGSALYADAPAMDPSNPLGFLAASLESVMVLYSDSGVSHRPLLIYLARPLAEGLYSEADLNQIQSLMEKTL